MQTLLRGCCGTAIKQGAPATRAMATRGESTESERLRHGALPLLAWNGADWAAWTSDGLSSASMTTLRVATWNVWFDRTISSQGGGAEERWAALFAILFHRSADRLDVVMLQELTRASWAVLLADERVRTEWAVTDLPATLARTRDNYGVAILCRRTRASAMGARASSVALPTRLGRCLVVLELGPAERPTVRRE